MAETAYAYVTLIPVAKGFKNAISKELSGTGGVGKTAGKSAGDNFKSGFDGALKGIAIAAGAALAAAGVAATKFAKDSIRAASDLQESTNAVTVSYLDSAEAVLAIGANSAKSLGLARNEFNQAAVRFSAFAQRIVGEGGDASGFIAEVTQRATDFASVFNIEVSEALRVFQSGLAGEAEPLKRFGINLLESEVKAFALRDGIIAVGEQLDETQKIQARYGLLLESTAKTAGDFANTSDGLANSSRILRAQFTDLQAEIGAALLPAFTELLNVVAKRVMPELENLGEFLNSPEGRKAIEDLATTVADLTVKFVDNLDSIIRTATSVATFVAGVKIATTVIQLATTAQLLFNVAVKANPYVLAATGLLAFVSAVVAFRKDTDSARISAQRQEEQIGVLGSEIDQLTEAYERGAIEEEAYENQLRALKEELGFVEIAARGTAGEVNRFNQLRLDSAIASMEAYKNATTLAERQAKTFADSYARLEAMGIVTPRISTEIDPIITGATGPTAAEIKAQMQDMVRDTKKALIDNRKDYNKAIKEANRDYVRAQADIAERYDEAITAATTRRDKAMASALEGYNKNVASINENSARALENVIKQSMDRLRNAFRSAAEVDVADMFSSDAINKNVGGLIDGLREKLAGSRRLIANAAELASQGFSQTFIEQVVGAGSEVGNEMAEGILNATPEQQRELRELFNVIEAEASTGMDALASTLQEKNGLATAELKKMYDQVLIDQTESLAEQKRLYEKTIADVMVAFNEEVAQAKKTRDEALMDAELALNEALLRANENFLDGLDRIEDAFKDKIKNMKGDISDFKDEIDALNRAVDRAQSRAATAITQYQGLIPFADGGLVTGPTPALIGEAGPELVIPLNKVESILGGMDKGKTLVYNAAPNQSVDSEQELFQAMRRAKVVANW